MEVIVLDEGSIVAEVDRLDGVAHLCVINGDWNGFIDWNNGVYWPNMRPDRRIQFTSWRTAVRGQDPYYD